MGLLFRILRVVLVPLLFMMFIKSLFADLLRRFAQVNSQHYSRTGGDYFSGSWGGGARSSYETYTPPSDPYQVLGLPRNADSRQIKERYRELIAKYHPDRFAGMNDPEFTRLASEKFQAVQNAYEQLRR